MEYLPPPKTDVKFELNLRMPDLCMFHDELRAYAPLSRNLMTDITDFNLTQLTSFPTRGNNFLDLVFTSDPSAVLDCWSSVSLSDHLGVCVSFVYEYENTNRTPKQFYDWQNANYQGIEQAFDGLASRNYTNTTADTIWRDFSDTALICIDEHIPRKTVPFRERALPRFLIVLIRKKERAYHAQRRFPSIENGTRFATLKRTVRNELRKYDSSRLFGQR